MENDLHCTIVASNEAGNVRLMRCTRPYGTHHYRVQVERLVDKRHATLEKATEHFARALASDTRHRFNDY